MSKLTFSIVTYNTDIVLLRKVISSITVNCVDFKLFVINNSPTDILREMVRGDDRIEYIYNNHNVGFGAGHNIAIRRAIEMGGKYHFVVNPDIFFEENVISRMVDFMDENEGIGMMMPKILYPDGRIQYLPKLLPFPISLLLRKLKRPKCIYERFIRRYEMRDVPDGVIYNPPILSGCFSLLNLKVIQEIGGYDEHFFMYFEDFDLSRRVHEKYKTLYFPFVSVYHCYEAGANKEMKLFKIFVNSAVRYFNKWGWFWDSKRKKINARVISELNLESK